MPFTISHNSPTVLSPKLEGLKLEFFYLPFHFLLDPDPEQIIPDPTRSGFTTLGFRLAAEGMGALDRVMERGVSEVEGKGV